jgi:hypothetical protein
MGKPPSHIADQHSIFLHLAPAHLETRDRFSHPPNKSQVQVTNSQNFAFLSLHVQSHGRWRTHFWYLFLRSAAEFDNLTAFEGRAVTTGVSMAQGWRFLFQFSLQSEC